jgi:uncharacterized protein
MATEPYQASEPASSGQLSSDEKMWGMLCHLSALAGYVIPFGNIIGPLVVWQLKKNESAFVDDQGKESVNFQITITIAAILAGLSFLILIGILLLPAVLLFGLVMMIVAAINANNGIWYRYPLTIRLIK